MKYILWTLLLGFALTGLDMGACPQTRRGWQETARSLPDLSLPSLQGEPVELRSGKGMARLVFLLRAKQRLSLNLLRSIRGLKQGDGGLRAQILFVTPDAIHRAWFEAQWADLSLPFPLLFDLGHRFHRDFRVRTFPCLLVFDRQGSFLKATGPGEGLEAGRIRAWARFASGQITQPVLRETLGELDSKRLPARRKALSLLLRAQRDLDRKEIHKARVSAQQAWAAQPDSIPIQLGVAKVLVQVGDHAQAKQLAASVLAKRPAHRRARTLLGIALFEQGEIDEAQRLLESALPLNPDPRLAQSYLARIHARKGEIDSALQFYRLALDPERRIQ